MRSATEVGGALVRLLADRGEDRGVEVCGRATVGLSQDTWFARLTDRGGQVEDVVVRLPTGASGDRAILAQRAALQAVAGTAVPAPAVRWADDGGDNPFGAPVLVMERLRGEVPTGWHEVAEPRRTALALATVDAMAALHAVPPQRAPTLRRPATSPAAEALAFHRRRFQQLGLADDPILRAAMWWLDRHLPTTRPTAIVHHDLRMGNLVVDGGRLVGVLDWEMAAIGDPHTDVVWCFVAVWAPAGVDVEAAHRRYEQVSASPLDPDVLRWELVMAYLRLAYYAASGGAAFATGGSHDLRLAALQHHLPVQLDRLAAAMAGEPVT